MDSKILIKRGPESRLPKLDEGELAFTTDTHKLYIGSALGNLIVSNCKLDDDLSTSTNNKR